MRDWKTLCRCCGWLLALVAGAALSASAAPGVVYYVAPEGKEGAVGTAERPFRTLEQARDAIRRLKKSKGLPAGGVEVKIMGGLYTVTNSFELWPEDSGEPDRPIVYRAAEAQPPRFYGGMRLHGFQPVRDPAVLDRLPESARAHVLECDLAKLGVGELRPFRAGGFGSGRGFLTHPRLELYFNGEPMMLARWPNTGFVRTGRVLGPRTLKAWDGRPGSPEGRFVFQSPRTLAWSREPELWLYGYWFWDWADSYEKVARIEPETGLIELERPWHRYGYREGQRFYVLNALCELDQPGEWYLDRNRRRLYFWPPGPIDQAQVELSRLRFPFMFVRRVSHVIFQGLWWECGAGDGVDVRAGEGVRFEGCVLRRLGGTGLIIRGGTGHQVVSCDLHTLGRGGMVLNGGDRRSLTPGAHTVENCHFYKLSRLDHTYTPGIWVEGVGHRVRHNLFHHIASSALRVEGNDHVIEFNEAWRVVTESDDQGAVDMYGNPAYRGNVFRYNYWHHLGPAPDTIDAGHTMRAGIRLDDAISGTLIYGNVFQRCGPPNTRFGGVQIHGGKDNRVEGNLFVDTPVAVSFSPWSLERWREHVRAYLKRDRVDRKLYLQRYPALAHLEENANTNLILSNVTVRCRTLLLRAPTNVVARANREHPDETAFPDTDDGRLEWSASEAKRLGVGHIPFETIGLFEDRWRQKAADGWRLRSAAQVQ